jgi:hypothetical protein
MKWGTGGLLGFPVTIAFQEGQNFKLLESKVLRIICAFKT